MSNFENLSIVVTGGARGIGAAVLEAFAEAGARVAAFDLGMTRSVSDRRIDLPVDVTDREGVFAAMAEVAEVFGGIDVLVNNAGIGRPNGLMGMTLEAWNQTFAVNLGGTLNCIQAAVPLMAQSAHPSIVNVASIAGKRMSYHGGPDYSASKAGMLGLTRHAAFELAAKRIRVNAICPGPVLTPLVEGMTTEEDRAVTASLMPLGRWVMPDDIAKAVLFFSGTGSLMCTGTSLDVDAGFLVGNGKPYAEYARARGL
ncbi:SDR family NAD(P)-dependent oxidoreductase [Pararhodobacter sp. CCB-MM2]|uniref:SDR family NAD(P)-dependent oxidoreductase n=1 Tax=Pararhodobacter sp. CCB-MM2 TaxID=1786003 RepID=UPI00082DF1AA|nr:SDR family oxidoreductase [Pararhodobacter sp. CCB-MM2]